MRQRNAVAAQAGAGALAPAEGMRREVRG
jgi:hypothetical protein